MKAQRFEVIDALRGLAVVWMTFFHLGFDLNHFGYIRQNFYADPLWTWQRTLIVSLFLFCAGLGQAVALAQGHGWARFWQRWVQVVACALLVTLGSWLMYPGSFIYFGVLHGLALMLLLARLTCHWGRWLWWLGWLAITSVLIAPYAMNSWATSQLIELFNAPMLNWIGWITEKPVTEDYVPLLPWLGLVWWGLATGKWLLDTKPGVLRQALAPALKPLAWLGRWSLSYYMLHQPVLIGGLMLASWLVK
ncbi:MAG TPA: heparan-alpha-glucosaminide N-acetyltransferase [Rhodoferax sp.]|nr:heparan-alpha-glucosaminide N-acetyltransferase [Rhodoferax sp.]